MNWPQRIEMANSVKSKQFTQTDIDDAHNWASCAVGECMGWKGKSFEETNGLFSELGREGYYLQKYGYEFAHEVNHDRPDLAIFTYGKIKELASKAKKKRSKK